MEYFISGNIMTNSQLTIWDVKIIYIYQTHILRIQAISNDTQKLQINKRAENHLYKAEILLENDSLKKIRPE